MRFDVPRLVLAGLGGGCGKTFLAVGVVRALRDRGTRVFPFKKGPDYIDAAWLSRAAGIPCRNLDAYLAGEAAVLRCLAEHGGGARRPHTSGGPRPGSGGVAVIEGARGLFDAMDETGKTSTAHLARLLSSPVVLVVDCTKVTRTVASMVLGCRMTDRRLRLAGVVLNRVGNARHEANIRSAIADLCDLPVLGALPRAAAAAVPERHLGLVMPDEHAAAEESVAATAEVVTRHVDLEGLLSLAASAPSLSAPRTPRASRTPRTCRVGVVRDSAFSFYYPENLEALEAEGATLVFVDATRDELLPEVDALYIGGGFPETQADRLASRPGFARSLRAAVEDGLPVYAECGGAVYVGRSVRVGDDVRPMAGILPIDFVLHRTPQGHGYVQLEATEENPFFAAGSRVSGHEFHYTAAAELPPGLPSGFRVLRGRGFGSGGDGLRYGNLLAVYSHVHASGAPEWAPGIVARAVRFAEARATKRARHSFSRGGPPGRTPGRKRHAAAGAAAASPPDPPAHRLGQSPRRRATRCPTPRGGGERLPRAIDPCVPRLRPGTMVRLVSSGATPRRGHEEERNMAMVNLGGKEVDVDEDGFITDPAIWSKELAAALAETEGVPALTDDHWKIVNYLRDYYTKFNIAPMIRKLCKDTQTDLKKIYELFPSGPAKGACKVAGLPKPTGCV